MSQSNYVSFWISWSDTFRLNDSVQGRAVCKLAYPGSRLRIWECWDPALRPGGAGGLLRRDGVASDVGFGVGSWDSCAVCCLCQLGGCAPVTLGLHSVSRCFALQFWQGRRPFVGFRRSIAVCLTIVVFNLLCHGISTPQFFSFRTSTQGCIIRYCISCTVVHENPPLATVARLNSRVRSDCSSCIRPPCLAGGVDMSKTCKKLVATLNNEIWLVHQPHMHLCPSLWWLMSAWSTDKDA